MSDRFYSTRFNKNVWLTNHAIESMAKRNITLAEIKLLIEEGKYHFKSTSHGWISHHFSSRNDNLICAAVTTEHTIVVKTVMVNWKEQVQL